MFTGIIEEVGTVESVAPGSGGARIGIRAPGVTRDLAIGGSVAVNGVCLTAETVGRGCRFTAFCTRETLVRTGLDRLRPGVPVNLELPLRAGAPIGGHIVQGHVDGLGAWEEARAEGEDAWTVVVSAPAALRRYLVEKGSVAVEGISLTVAGFASARGKDCFRLAVIPETWRRTNLSHLRPGDPVRIEVDILAKYVESLLGRVRPGGTATGGITEESLREKGFTI